MKNFAKDVQFALRSLAKRRGFTAVILLTLGLGIGINLTVYTLTHSFLFRPLPFPESDRLAMVVGTLPKMGWNSASLSLPEMEDIRQRSRLLEKVSVFESYASPSLEESDNPEKLRANFTDASFFSILQARAATGRTFLPEESRQGAGQAVAVLSHGFWQRLGGDRSVIDSKINLSGQPFTVVGVMPPGFHDIRNDYERTDVWLPLPMGMPFYGDDMYGNRVRRQYLGVATLREGVTLAQAQGELDEIARQLQTEHIYAHEGRGFRLVTPYEWYYADVDGPAKTLVAGALIVLLLCCVNIATLLLVRGRARLRELAVRSALGAARAQLVRQILAEAVLLAVLGGALGLLIAWWAVKGLVALGGLSLPPFSEVQPDAGMVLVSLALTLATGLLFGLLPAWQLTRADLSASLQSTRKTAGRSGIPQRHLVTIAEVALSAVLLVGAGLTIKSLYRLANTDLGFDTRNLLTMQLELNTTRYDESPKIQRIVQNILADLREVPTVESAVIWGPSMIGEARWNLRVTPEGMAPTDPRGRLMVQRMHVTPGALKALGIPLLKGRDFTESDLDDLTPDPNRRQRAYSAIIDERLANTLWPGQDAVGKRFYRGDDTDLVATVVGVAANVLHRGRTGNQDKVAGDVYLSILEDVIPNLSILVRYKSDPSGTLDSVRRVVARHDPALAVFDVSTMEERLVSGEAGYRFNTVLLSLYGVLAILLAILGIYGVLAYSVQQRGPEMAIRSTFGASPRSLLWMVIRQGMLSAALGAVIGLAAAVVLSRYIESLLFQVSHLDPALYAVVGGLMLLVALAACYLPARRAGAADPVEALRSWDL